jgi:hypothetical protein
MALKLGDVLNVLSDPVVTQIDFWVGSMHLTGKRFDVMRDHIVAGNIEVVEGTHPSNAFYDYATDVLITQNVTSPPSLEAKALLLHECSHAVFDIFADAKGATRHQDELAAYLIQHAFILRSNPAWAMGSGSGPWFDFFTALLALVKARNLHQNIGNGTRFTAADIEPLRLKLAALPGLDYGSYTKTDPSGADGLKKMNPFIEPSQEPVSMRYSSVSKESYPDPSDEYLIRTLSTGYNAANVRGYGGRLRELRRDFARCSVTRARQLLVRLAARKPGDKVSELFYDKLSTEGRAILLRILRMR